MTDANAWGLGANPFRYIDGALTNPSPAFRKAMANYVRVLSEGRSTFAAEGDLLGLVESGVLEPSVVQAFIAWAEHWLDWLRSQCPIPPAPITVHPRFIEADDEAEEIPF